MASPTTSTLARTLTRTTLRPWLRRAALPLGLGLTTGLLAVHRQRPMHFDFASAPAAAVPQQVRAASTKRRDLLDAETIKELSGGSLSGFLTGLLVSVFSKTLVLLAGIGMVVIQLAAHNGIDLVGYLHLKERAKTSRILAALDRHTAFKLSFALAFALSAFMSF